MESVMSDITVVSVSNPSLKGTTLYVEEPPAKAAKGAHRMDSTGLITPTAVYIPASYNKAGELNVILCFHGHHVKDYQTQIFAAKDTAGGETKLRESVDAAGQNVVLVVPYLGRRESGDGKSYVMPNHGGGGVADYLEKLLDVLVTNGHLG